jgi:iron complex transport system substrate-binding protein
MFRVPGLGLLVALLVATPLAAEPLTVTGADGRTVTIDDASRIVSVGGTVTETLYALGVGDRVVGVDLTSNYPEAANKLPKVGYMRQLAAEGVLALGPTVIIAIEDAGPPETIAVLAAASVPLVLVPKAHDAAGVAASIRLIAEAAGVPEQGVAMAEGVSADLAAVEAMLDRIDARRKAVFVLGVSGGSPTVAGSGTAAADMFALSHVDNAMAAADGYKPSSDEAVMASAPDAVVLMADRSHHLSDDQVLAVPAFAGTPAAASGQLIRMSGGYLLNFGPRTAHAVRDLAAAIYPEAGLPALPARPWSGAEAPAPGQ